MLLSRRALLKSATALAGSAALMATVGTGDGNAAPAPPAMSADAALLQAKAYLSQRGWKVTRYKLISQNSAIVMEAQRPSGKNTLTQIFLFKVVVANDKLVAQTPPSEFKGSFPG